MRPVRLRLAWAACLFAACAAALPLGAEGDGAKDWAAAVAGSLKDLDPIAAAEIQELNPELRLAPGLLRLRAIDPQDANQRAALDALFRSLEEKGYTPQSLRSVHVDETVDRHVIEDFSKAYEAGLAQASAFSDQVARNIESLTPEETSPGALALLQSRLTAMALLYGDAAVAKAKRSLKRKLGADGAAAAVFFSLP